MNNFVPGAGNAIRDRAGPGAAAARVQITTSNPLGSLSPLLALLLASNLNGGGSPYPYYPYYGSYGAYGPYIPHYYYSGYPYYYYYYYYRG
ncbi:unnamed protein product [Cercopithifilaria johnstoni]|uniref:Uncharacterized protein n=1 Tax=Cercopithifilaria johnstoni TaxID=2874296 RepID=A0A8J2Q4H5_9BILA|nr:unnamed protein product [Cercopithifilaria johnstoni]